jgi:hypothetical protein
MSDAMQYVGDCGLKRVYVLAARHFQLFPTIYALDLWVPTTVRISSSATP